MSLINMDFMNTQGGEDITPIEYIKNRVMSNTLDIYYNFVPYSNRVSLNEGRCGVDTTNKIFYFYADFNILTAQATDYLLLNTSPVIPSGSYYEYGASGITISNNLFIQRPVSVSGSESLSYDSFKFTQYTAGSTVGIATKTISVKVGERYIVCFAWYYQ